MKFHLIFLAFVAGALTGCHKGSPSASAPEQAPPGPEVTAENSLSQGQPDEVPRPAQPPKPLPPPPPAVAARAVNVLRQSVSGEVDPFLTGELRNFIQLKQRLPQSFAEFATLRLDSIPRPPEGKRWVIDATDLQVKAVPAQ